MPSLVWDEVGTRQYETGIDKGVLYLPDGSAVAWNGLTSVVESSDKEGTPVYYDGRKINQLVTLGDFNGTMKAITYPDEFLEIEGLVEVITGVYAGDQQPQVFGLSYRTRIGNDETYDLGYKIHLLYNVTAIPNDKTYLTLSDTSAVTDFEWVISAVPEEVVGMRPTAHLIFDSTEFDPGLLAVLEEILYGSEDTTVSLIPMADLISFLKEYHIFKIIDNHDGTWTAICDEPDIFHTIGDGVFEIDHIPVVWIDDDTFKISDSDVILP